MLLPDWALRAEGALPETPETDISELEEEAMLVSQHSWGGAQWEEGAVTENSW